VGLKILGREAASSSLRTQARTFFAGQGRATRRATNESGGEAEIAGGVGVRRGAATRSLRSARGAAHSVAARKTMWMIHTAPRSAGLR
jgi:hypothetical protein